MLKQNPSKFFCIGAIFIAFAVIFQSAPIFLPSIGLAISPLSTLPTAIAAATNISLGLIVFLSSAIIIAMISIEESLIFLFTTGLLGMVIGSLLLRKGRFLSIFLSTIALTLGMFCLTYVVGITAFVDFTTKISTPMALIVFFLFSVVYGCIWIIGIQKLLKFCVYNVK